MRTSKPYSCRKRSSVSSVVGCTCTQRFTHTTFGTERDTKAKSCDTVTSVKSSFSAFKLFNKRSSAATSTCAVGSSSNNTSTSAANARAINTAWRCPPESAANESCVRSAKPICSSASSARDVSLRLAKPKVLRSNRPISTTSSTVTGNSGSKSICCGTYPTRERERFGVSPSKCTLP